MVRPLPKGLAEVVAVERLYIGVFVREAQRLALVEPPKHAAARLRQLPPVADGLTAAARAAAGAGHDLDEIILHLAALDGIAVIVNAGSEVSDLSVEQIAKIFTGEITDWSEVGGAAGKISCIGREAGSGTRDGFESITGTTDACKLDQELTSTGGVIEAVAGNANAIGYASLSAVEGKDTVKTVTVGGVACTEATVLDGSYAIQRPFVLVTKSGAALSPAAQAFFDYATSTAANELIKAAGAVPVAK